MKFRNVNPGNLNTEYDGVVVGTRSGPTGKWVSVRRDDGVEFKTRPALITKLAA